MGKGIAVQDNAGLAKLLGTFSAPPPLCVHEPYSGPLKTENRFKGTQIVTGKLRHEKSQFGNNDGTFAPALMMWSESKDQYQDCIRYKDIYGVEKKKLGFGTSDYPKRDEYSDTKKTQQLRETLKKETLKERAARDATDKIVQQTRSRGTIPGAHLSATQILQQANATVVPAAPLFDIVYRIPEASLRLARDDRQAKFYYQTERIKAMQGAGAVPAPETPHPSRWYNIKVDGRQMQVLVNHYGQVVEQRLL